MKRSRRGRQLRAQALRLEGHSLREIAKLLGCSYQTVARDLAEAAKLSHLPVTKPASRAPECDTECDSANVIQLRRRA
jgi:transposase